ncbi:MAG: hypothetical protein AAB495_01065 [Patescibacteria group bacterium]
MNTTMNVADLLAAAAADTAAAREARMTRIANEKSAEREKRAERTVARALGHDGEIDVASKEIADLGALIDAKRTLTASIKDARGDDELEARLKGRLSEIENAISTLEGEGETGQFRSLIARLATAEPMVGPAIYFAEAGVNLKILAELDSVEALARMTANKAAKEAKQEAPYGFIWSLPVKGATGRPEVRYFTRRIYDRKTESEMHDRVFVFVGRRGQDGHGFAALMDGLKAARETYRTEQADLEKVAQPSSGIFIPGAEGVFKLAGLTRENPFVVTRQGRPDIHIFGTFFVKVTGGVLEFLHGPAAVKRQLQYLGLVDEDGTPVPVHFGPNFSNLRAPSRGGSLKGGRARAFFCKAAGLAEDTTVIATTVADEPEIGTVGAAMRAASARNARAVGANAPRSEGPKPSTKGRKAQRDRDSLRDHLGPVSQ